ncbi:zeaxanthin epoxidase, chloroplastic [Fagus crenata]
MASTVLCNSSINSSTIVFSRTHFPLLVSKDFPVEFPPYIHFNHHFKTRTNTHKKKLLHVKAQVVEAPTVSPPPLRGNSTGKSLETRSGKWVLEKTMVEELIEELQSTVEAIVL